MEERFKWIVLVDKVFVNLRSFPTTVNRQYHVHIYMYIHMFT